MKTEARENQDPTLELMPLNVIRVETAISRYPVHRLAKQGTAAIEIREKNESGDVVIRWEVSHNSRYGQPGPLAYKLDTLIVNRRIEEATRPIPKLVRLGSLKDICRELGLAENGKNTNHIKTSLSQNALAGITAKIRCRLADGTEQRLEAVFTRYAVIFTGEELPDGRKADAVYLELSDRFMHILNGAQTRPLDYDYLRDLAPAAQRLYELLSYQMYAALKHGRPRARLSYGEFCSHAPLTRHLEWLRARTQMNKLHGPHKKSGYIASVEFEQTTDQDGKPDWNMLYTPGARAKAEFRAFTKRGGPRTLEIEQSPPALKLDLHQVEPSPLERELIERGVMATTAAKLVDEIPEEQISRQVEHFDWLKAKSPKSITKSPGGFLADAIRRDYPTPPGFETKAEKTARDEAKREQLKREAEATRERHQAHADQQKHRAQVEAYLSARTPEELEQLDKDALEQSEPEIRASFDAMPHAAIRKAQLRIIRDSHVRRTLGLPQVSE
jgi:hypothetical protein